MQSLLDAQCGPNRRTVGLTVHDTDPVLPTFPVAIPFGPTVGVSLRLTFRYAVGSSELGTHRRTVGVANRLAAPDEFTFECPDL